ncbi:kinesin-like protein KIN-14I isoform X1 [Amaranthus tricolor]|uniref:kinesin-like protein KIN-14I isoform X1 n=1 Tax=Amaranthus tricolor TaxID=29722 RepID=UPI00258FA594|nr:kinesin-like protein KIN-14I isoform X1 [Amaranthus tricolor]
MAEEGMMPFSVVSIIEDVIRQHGTRLSDVNFASRKAEEASSRRYDAARWLRKIVGVVCSKDLPAEPSEEDFRLGLRSGIVLCTAINKVQPGAIPKVVEAPNDTVIIPDGAALMAYQYFENVRNFLVAVEEMGLPTFEASDLEQGGKTGRIVNCVLALKSFSDWKVAGGSGAWKYSGKTPSSSGKTIVRKNSEPFMNSVSRTSSVSERSLDNEQCSDVGADFSDMSNYRGLNMMIRTLLVDKKLEEIPVIVESMLNKVMEEFERRLTSQSETIKNTPETMSVSGQNTSPAESPKSDTQNDYDDVIDNIKEPNQVEDKREIQLDIPCGALKSHIDKHGDIFERQRSSIEELKQTVFTTKESMKLMQMKYHDEFSILGKHLYSLAHAASGYQRVLQENRKLYNIVQDLKGNIRVYCRVRPFLPGQANGFSTVDHIEDGNITLMNPAKYNKEGKKTFTFNKVFGPTASQAEVYADMQPLVRSCLDGYNVCIFAYGQTGSGKTFTMTGPNNLTEETYGVNYRALNDLFCLTEERKDTFSYEVSVQMMEIYNEQVRDLLAMDGSNKKLEIRNSTQNGINVPDASRLPVSTTDDVISLMNLGHKNRAVSSTAMNDRSSRSHSCMTVHVQGKDLTSGAALRGCMHLVDLAGSERVDKSEVTGDRLKEAQHINKSLAALGDVIASLSTKNAHVPYRNSKLTQLLQDSLGGQAKTLMFVHISPEADAIGETISTLKFAERVSTVELGAARANKETGDVKDLKEQIANLKAALAKKEEEFEYLSNSVTSTPETLSVKSAASSPIHPSYRASRDPLSGRKSPVQDASNNKKKNNSTKPRRRSLDPNDLLSNTAHWPPLSANKAEQRNLAAADWMDKILKKNKVDKGRSIENFVEENSLEADKKDFQDDDSQFNMYDLMTPESIDEFEIATSDSSEQDFQVHLPRVASLPNGMGSKIKKPTQVKPSKSPEKRSLIPMPPTRRLSNGSSGAPAIKNGKQGVHMKWKPGSTK